MRRTLLVACLAAIRIVAAQGLLQSEAISVPC